MLQNNYRMLLVVLLSDGRERANDTVPVVVKGQYVRIFCRGVAFTLLANAPGEATVAFRISNTRATQA
jgi:hypothetical protein